MTNFERLGPMFGEAAELDPRLADLFQTMQIVGESSCEHSIRTISVDGVDLPVVVPDDLFRANTAAWLHGFLIAARLAQIDPRSLGEIMHLISHSPVRDAVVEADDGTFVKGLCRQTRRSDA